MINGNNFYPVDFSKGGVEGRRGIFFPTVLFVIFRFICAFLRLWREGGNLWIPNSLVIVRNTKARIA